MESTRDRLRRCTGECFFSSRSAAFCALGLAGGSIVVAGRGNRGARRGYGWLRLPRQRRRGMATSRNSSKRASPPIRSARSYAGRHEFDGKLPDLTAPALRRDVGRLETARARTLAFDPAGLTPERQRERDYLLAAIEVELFWEKEAEWPYRNPAYYMGFLDPEIYLSKPYAPLEPRMRAYIAYARELPRVAREIRANLRTPMPAPWIDYGVNAFGGFAQFFSQRRGRGLFERQGPGPANGAGTGKCRRGIGDAGPRGLAQVRTSARDAGISHSVRSCSRACWPRRSRSTCRSHGCRKSAAPISSAISRRCARSAALTRPARPCGNVLTRPTAISPRAVPWRQPGGNCRS